MAHIDRPTPPSETVKRGTSKPEEPARSRVTSRNRWPGEKISHSERTTARATITAPAAVAAAVEFRSVWTLVRILTLVDFALRATLAEFRATSLMLTASVRCAVAGLHGSMFHAADYTGPLTFTRATRAERPTL